MTTKVLIVEDDPMARTLFEIYLKNSERYRMTAAIESASMAELYCLTGQVDLIIMDVCTALNGSGLEAAAKIKKNYPQIKIIIVTSQPECSFINRAREAGVDSFWYKAPSEKEILSVMDRTMDGESVYPDSSPQLKIGTAWSTEFTECELKILRELTEGDTDEEIAEKLHLSAWTVRKYVKIMLEKTNFKSRTQMAVAARESGLVIKGY
ncbi:MAG: response regulator transcription factor [Candidatus Choladocola sp.]|nr:response regulator transcription factor [Candidatus Choladocola sp.]